VTIGGAFKLIDDKGHAVTDADYRGRWAFHSTIGAALRPNLIPRGDTQGPSSRQPGRPADRNVEGLPLSARSVRRRCHPVAALQPDQTVSGVAAALHGACELQQMPVRRNPGLGRRCMSRTQGGVSNGRLPNLLASARRAPPRQWSGPDACPF
jgi:hypothetical protein